MQLTKEKLIDAVRNSGIVGAGGGGFPTHVKLNAQADIVIANGAECEPLLSTDRYLMETRAGVIVEALRMVKNITGAKTAVIALKGKYKEAISELKKETGMTSDVSLHLLDNFYPAGDEFEIVKEVTGKTIPEGGIPLHIGAIVINVNTLLNVYESFTSSNPVITRWVTVGGEVEKPYIAEVPLGISTGELIDLALPSLKDYAVLIGGPMMGSIKDRTFSVTKLSSGIIVLPRDNTTVEKMTLSINDQKRRGRSTCDQCFDCTITCPRNLLGHDLHPHKIMRNLFISPSSEKIHNTNAYLCCECGLCDMFACPLDLSPRSIFRNAKRVLMNSGIKNPHSNSDLKKHPERDFRRVSQDKLLYRLGLKKYDLHEYELRSGISTDRVRLNLSQHIGAPSVPVVSVGDSVNKGDLIAEIPDKSLGSRLHASIKGEIEKISDDFIDISVKR